MTSRATHLTEVEFVDLLDGTLDASRRQHVDGCEPCAAQAADLVASAHAASDLEIPEPPPFFWPQLSARVSDAIANQAARPGLAAFAWARASWVAAAAVVVMMVMFVPRNRGETPRVSTGSAAGTAAAAAHPDAVAVDDTIDLDSDEAWALVRSLAEDLDADQMDAEGVSPGAGAAERLALQLTDAERAELARLLEEQLRRGGTLESAS
jgi:hypothetical protein